MYVANSHRTRQTHVVRAVYCACACTHSSTLPALRRINNSITLLYAWHHCPIEHYHFHACSAHTHTEHTWRCEWIGDLLNNNGIMDDWMAGWLRVHSLHFSDSFASWAMKHNNSNSYCIIGVCVFVRCLKHYYYVMHTMHTQTNRNSLLQAPCRTCQRLSSSSASSLPCVRAGRMRT